MIVGPVITKDPTLFMHTTLCFDISFGFRRFKDYTDVLHWCIYARQSGEIKGRAEHEETIVVAEINYAENQLQR